MVLEVLTALNLSFFPSKTSLVLKQNVSNASDLCLVLFFMVKLSPPNVTMFRAPFILCQSFPNSIGILQNRTITVTLQITSAET